MMRLFSTAMIVAGASAAIRHAPGHPDAPACGMEATISALMSSGCRATEARCLCNNPDFMEAVRDRVPIACRTAKEQSSYYSIVADMCAGQIESSSTALQFELFKRQAAESSSSSSPAASSAESGSLPVTSSVLTGIMAPTATQSFTFISNMPLQTWVANATHAAAVTNGTASTHSAAGNSTAPSPSPTNTSDGHYVPVSIGYIVLAAVLAVAGF